MAAAFAPALHGQAADRPIDRWLFTDAQALIPGANPLQVDDTRLFPDRDLDVGPGYWRLVREDGARVFPLTGGGVTLAHAYVKAPRDATVRLETSACEGAALWVNGQPAFDSPAEITVRLAGGWNTLLVAAPTGGEGCDPELAVALSAPTGPIREDERPIDVGALAVQASRPPGARPNFPSGVLELGSPRPVSLAWNGPAGRLSAHVEFAVTAWGRPAGLAGFGRSDEEAPTGPPTVDPTGEWILTLYAPTGIIEARATLQMSEEGVLTGRVEGERLSGEIRDGWVSGEEFGWVLEAGGRRGDAITLRGAVADDAMSGTLDFGGFREFEARFEGRRATDEDEADEAGAGEAEEEAGPPGGRGRPLGGRDAPDLREALGDLDDQRARIVRLLLPPPDEPPPAAPAGGSIEIEIGGDEVTTAFADLTPLRPRVLGGDFEFERVRSAALDDEGVSARVEWHDDDHEFVGTVDPTAMLSAVHEPIRLEGWGLEGAEGYAGTFRIPEALDGFTLGVGEGQWSVGGAPLEGTILCSPCREGVRFELAVRDSSSPTVRIIDGGYPGPGDGVPEAAEWLEALGRDNARYLEMARRFGDAATSGVGGTER